MPRQVSEAPQAPQARILIWDIETRNLVGDYGSLFCIGWKWLGEDKIHVKSIHDIPGKHPLDDKALVEWFIKNVWNHADIAVGWYSTGHDEPFLLTRAIIHGSVTFTRQVKRRSLPLPQRGLCTPFATTATGTSTTSRSGKTWPRRSSLH